MKRLIVSICLAIACGGGTGLAAHPALAATLCVGHGPGCYATIQAALDAAHDGDVIHIGAGTFAGGITITKSVRIIGAGAGDEGSRDDQSGQRQTDEVGTTIKGGGPVLTIGILRASSEPTVSIDGVTITGGVAHSSPESMAFVGQAGVIAMGGGVEIPPNATFSGGATVSISNSVITGNRADPTTAIGSGLPCPSDITTPCINGDLPFAWAAGGGIDSWGALTVTNTSVTNNLVGATAGHPSVASDADGAGIAVHRSSPSLTMSNTIVSGNRASAVAPNGRFADSAGIFDEAGTLTMSNSVISNNQANLAASMPSDVPQGTLAIAGGVHVTNAVTAASIRNSTISHNSISMTNTVGDATAFSGGLHTDVNVALSNDVIADNSVTSATLPGSTGNAQGDSAAGEMGGAIDNTRLTGNSVTVSSAAGNASTAAGSGIFTGTMTSGVVSGNLVRATSPNGSVLVTGAGLVSGGPLTLRNTTVSDNIGDARGRTGAAQGGGIFAVDQSPNGPPGGPLILTNSRITGNVLSGNANISLQGGGLYVTNPLTLTNSTISRNVPDNCFGSSC